MTKNIPPPVPNGNQKTTLDVATALKHSANVLLREAAREEQKAHDRGVNYEFHVTPEGHVHTYSGSFPYSELVHQTQAKMAALQEKAEHLESELASEKTRRLAAEEMVGELINMIPVNEEPSG